MRLLSIVIALAASLAGCTHVALLYVPHGPPDKPQSPAQPTIRVAVLPRVGLFDELTYGKRDDYVHSLPQGALITTYGLPNDWVAVFPKDAGGSTEDSYCVEDERTLCGNLNKRWVRLTVSGFSSLPSCHWWIPSAHIQQEGCDTSIALSGNKRAAGSVTIKAAGIEHAISFEIPSDRLIVSLGDSYASGEGNPDSPLTTSEDGSAPANPAVWMSRRCHRSIWAGPIRAGLKMGTTFSHTMNDGVAVETSGAVTVVSAACSGAEITHLLNRGYAGRESLGQLRLAVAPQPQFNKMPLSRITSDNLSRYRRLEGQLRQISDLLSESDYSNREIYAVILSIGGNDINFAELVQTLMVKDQRDLEQAKADIKYDIDSLEKDFTELAQRIESDLRPGNVYLSAYPDPTRKTVPSQGKAPTFCSCSDESFLGMSLIESALACMTSSGSAYASNAIVSPLNIKLATIAAGQGWYFIHGGADPYDLSKRALTQFDGHAWCSPEDIRWIRTLADSTQLQGLLPGSTFLSTGAMHPTANGHEAYMDLIDEAITERSRKPPFAPSFAFSSGAVEGINGTRIVGRHVELSWQPGKLLNPLEWCKGGARYCQNVFAERVVKTVNPDVDIPRRATDEPPIPVCLGRSKYGNYGDDKKPCQIDYDTHTLRIELPDVSATGEFELNLRVRDAMTRKRVTLPPITRLDMDSSWPIPICSMSGPDWSDTCTNALKGETWLHGPVKLVLKASDDKSGFKRWNCSGNMRDVCIDKETIEWPNIADGKIRLDLKISPEDRVGNKMPEYNPFGTATTLKVDSRPPQIDEVQAFDVVWQSDVEPLIVTNEDQTNIFLLAKDEIAGVRRRPTDEDCSVGSSVRIPWQLSRAPGTPDRRIEVIAIPDCATPTPNRTQKKIGVQFIPLQQGARVETIRYWREKLAANADNIERFQTLVSELTNNMINVSALDEHSMPIAAAWMNLLDGRVSVSAKIDMKNALPKVCGKATGSTSFAFLKNLTECYSYAGFDRSFRAKTRLQTARLLGR